MKSTVRTLDRAGYTPAEFAALFGREKTWSYRQFYAGRLKMIEGYGGRLVPASEVERIMGKAKEIIA